MAEVFEAELAGHLGFVRKVAIKRMLEVAAADPSAAQRFLDEATIASRLHHANVISVVDFGLLDDRPFQVLEYVDGIDAFHLLQRAGGKLPLEVALAIASDVAHALDHAHSAIDASGLPLGIVHRDVKPSNVLLSWGGDVKLGDFGIAVAHNRAATTEAGVVAGTLGFIAPEQRQRGTLDGRTDVFALGLTLHALITGASPLADIEVEMRVLAGDPVPLDGAFPDDIRALLVRALATERTARPTAGELAAQLGVALAPRLAGDRRSLLRDFLAEYAPRAAPRAGALDALLGIEVVMTGGSKEDVHRFETRAASKGETPASRPSATPSAVATTPERIAAATVVEPKIVPRDAPTEPTISTPKLVLEDVPSRRRAGPIALAILGLGAVGGIAVWQLRGRDTPSIDASVVASDDGSGQPSGSGTNAAKIGDDPAPADASSPDAAIASPGDARPASRGDAAIRRDAGVAGDASVVRIDAAQAADAMAQDVTGTGYIQVLGADLIGASVIIDGRNVGSVPNPFAVSLGSHTVEVEKRDGSRLPPRRVDVTATHNKANPVHPSW